MISDDRIIECLLSTKSISEAAEKVPCDRATIHRRLNDPEFREAMDDYRWASMEIALARLQSETPASVAFLVQQRDDTTLPPKVRQTAAAHVIRQVRGMSDLMVNRLERQS